MADSAQLFPHPHGFPRRLKLKQLAADFLHQRIQTGKNGHDSVEDARAAWQLVQLKVEKGPHFGLCAASARVPLLEQLSGPTVTSALIWQQFSHCDDLTPVSSSSSSSPSESSPAEEQVPELCQGQSSGSKQRFVMERCVGGQAQVAASLASCQAAVSSACGFLSRHRLQWTAQPPMKVEQLLDKAFCHLTVRHDRDLPEQAIIQRLQTAVVGPDSATYHPHCLLIVTSQPGLGEVQRLLTQRRLCESNPMSSLRWSAEREMTLTEEIKKVALGRARFVIL